MTVMLSPQQWYSTNQGKALLVPGQPSSLAGQCEQAVDCYIHDALGLPYVYTPNAHEFWDNYSSLSVLNQNFDKVTNGQFLTGDIVVYASNLPGSEGSGHVDIVASAGSKSSYLGYDSNWGGNLTLHEVNHSDSNNAYILGSLRRKGIIVKPTQDEWTLIHYGWTGQAPGPAFLSAVQGMTLEQGVAQYLDGKVNPTRKKIDEFVASGYVLATGTVLKPGNYTVQ